MHMFYYSNRSSKLIECRYTHEDRDGRKVSGDPLLAVQITREGRKLVRQALGFKSQRRKPGELTASQQAYADAIVAAELAPREEVEAAFRERSGKGDREISWWGGMLRERSKKAYQEYLRSLTRHEPCAYPNCAQTIEVRKVDTQLEQDEHPRPARTITITHEVPGWHWEVGWSGKRQRVRNTETITRHLYACSKRHEEGIYRLRVVDIVLTLDEEEERRLQGIRYPLDASEEARWEFMDMARTTALDMVARADEQDLVQTRPRMRAIAQQQLAALLAASDLATLTDNPERFKTTYRKQFVIGYSDALAIRASILEKGSDLYSEQQRWKPLYEKRERMKR
jgi:hypothetical protein